MRQLFFIALMGLVLGLSAAHGGDNSRPAKDVTDIAKCTRAAEKDALTALTDDPPGATKDELKEKATRELAALAVKERAATRKCLTED